MAQKNWNGIMKVLEVQHWDAKGNLLWEQKNVLNILHQDGEEFLLRAAFTGGRASTIIPDVYELGLDNRQAVDVEDTMDDLIGEPPGGGYERQEVASAGDFAINFEENHFVATSPIVAFRATTGAWGPVSNLFLTNKPVDTIPTPRYLISTAVLNSAISLNPGDAVTMRIGMQLKDCPT